MTSPFESSVLTRREQRGLAYLGLLAWGTLSKGPFLQPAARMVGLGGLVSELWGWAKDSKVFANPDTMNAYFKTGGALSGIRSDGQARAIRNRKVVVR